jgi:hypothetical protein
MESTPFITLKNDAKLLSGLRRYEYSQPDFR